MYDGTDRVKQIDALNQLAEELFESLPVDTVRREDVTAEEVTKWLHLSSDARDHELPPWFDDHDMAYLTDQIRERFDYEPMILSELAQATGLTHDQLRHAIHDGRLEARQLYKSGPWLSTIANVEAALEAGVLQRRPGRPPRAR